MYVFKLLKVKFKSRGLDKHVSNTIIRNPSAFEFSYIPPRLIDREEQMEAIRMMFGEYVKRPGSYYARALLVGNTGTGKTLTAIKFGQFASSGSRVRFIYVPCWTHRTMHSAVRHIGEQLKINVPRRGLSADEILEFVYDYMRDHDIYALIVLDDVFHIVNNSGADALGSMIRFYDEHMGEGEYRFSLMLISKDESILDKLDAGARSTLGSNIVKFTPYSKDQIYEILRDRASIGLSEGSYDDEILEMIADVTGFETGSNTSSRGNAKQAIEILWRAALIAQQSGSRKIMPEHVRMAVKYVTPFNINELTGMELHEKIFLLAIVNALRKKETPYVTFGEAEEEYMMLCEKYGLKGRRSHAQLWHYLRDMKENWQLIETRLSGKGMRGRTTLISIPYEPLGVLAQELEKLISKDLGVG